VRISSTGAIEGGRVLYTIGRIEAASAWHPENGAPRQDNWEELVLRELIRKAEDIDADAIIRVDYQTGPPMRIDEIGVKLKRVVATALRSSFPARPRVLALCRAEERRAGSTYRHCIALAIRSFASAPP
jgi:hypothetical protein